MIKKMKWYHQRLFFVKYVREISAKKVLYKKRHKCADERKKPVNEQRGAVQCLMCH